MKLQTSKKNIKNGFNTVISISYCGAQYLLYYKSPFAYSAGVYGWACDYYQIGAKCISTGYNPIGKYVDYKKLCELEKKAEIIVHDYILDYDVKVKKIDLLLTELINSVN